MTARERAEKALNEHRECCGDHEIECLCGVVAIEEALRALLDESEEPVCGCGDIVPLRCETCCGRDEPCRGVAEAPPPPPSTDPWRACGCADPDDCEHVYYGPAPAPEHDAVRLLREVASSGVEHEGEWLRYLGVRVAKGTWTEVRAYVAALDAKKEGK